MFERVKSWLPWGKEKGIVDQVHYEAGGFDTGLGQRTVREAFQQPENGITPELAAKIYSNSPFVNAAIRILADQLSSVPLRVYVEERNSKKRTEKRVGQPFLMLNFVNPHMTASQLIAHTVSWLKLSGNAFWAIEETPPEYRGSTLSEWSIFPMMPQYVTIRPHPSTGVKEYVYRINGKEAVFPETRVIHFRNFNPFDPWYGHSDLNSLSFDMQVERYAKRKISTWYANAASIGGIIEIPKDIHEDEAKKLKRELQAQYTGTRNAHRVLVLTQGMVWKDTNFSDTEVGAVPVLENSAAAHSMVIGVPMPLLVGVLAGQSKDLLQYESQMWKQTLIPLAVLIQQTLSKRLAVPMGMKIQQRILIEFDFSQVDALRTEKLDRIRGYVAAIASGYLTLNEVRTEENLDEYPAEHSDIADVPMPKYLLKEQASLSASLPGDPAGRNQGGSGETEHVDTTGKKGQDEDGIKALTDIMLNPGPVFPVNRFLSALKDFSETVEN